jgi:hypothetical protein
MHIVAVKDEHIFDIKAAAQSREVVMCRSMLIRAGIDPNFTKQISMHELSTALSGAQLTIQQRIMVKTSLIRAGLVSD